MKLRSINTCSRKSSHLMSVSGFVKIQSMYALYILIFTRDLAGSICQNYPSSLISNILRQYVRIFEYRVNNKRQGLMQKVNFCI